MTEKVVLQYGDRILKGTTDIADWTGFLKADHWMTPPILPVGESEPASLSIDDAKAVFFVTSFEGTSHDPLRFYDAGPPLPCLWVRVTFLDGEQIEGLIQNDSSYVLGSRFLMAPVDPDGNNRMILIPKHKLVEFQILGLRQPLQGLPDFFKNMS